MAVLVLSPVVLRNVFIQCSLQQMKPLQVYKVDRLFKLLRHLPVCGCFISHAASLMPPISPGTDSSGGGANTEEDLIKRQRNLKKTVGNDGVTGPCR